MPSQTNYITTEHSIADTPSGNMGTSKDDHAPVGYSGSWVYRELLKFSTSGPPSGAKIVSCHLSLKTTSGVHFQHGSSPRIVIHRLTSSFSQSSGGGTETWRTDADPVWPGPSAISTGEVDVAFGNADNYVRTFNITDIYEAICSTSLFKRDGSPAGGSTNYGIRLRAYSEGSTADRVEFHTMRGSYVPRVEITWTMPKAATAPALISPLGVQPSAPTEFSFQWPSGDGTEKLEIEVGTALDTSNLWNPAPTTHTPGPVKTVAYGGTAIPVDGSTVYWRVRGLNEVGTPGPWSKGTFTVTSAPAAVISHPANNGIAETWNLQSDHAEWAGSEGKPFIRVLYTHPGGLDSASFDVDDDGVITNYPFVVSPGETAWIAHTTGWARNVNHTVRVRVNGSGGLQSPWSAAVVARIQWAQGRYAIPHVAGARDFAEAHGTLTGGGKVAFLYRNAAVPGSWFEEIGEFEKGTQIDMLIRLGANNTTDNPTLPVARIEWYGSGTTIPEFWTKGPAATIASDKGFRRFGVHSVHAIATAAANVSQNRSVIVTKGIRYTLSAYVSLKSTGVGLRLRVLDKDGALNVPDLVAPLLSTGHTTDTSKAPDGWQRLYWTFVAPADEIRLAILIEAAGEFWMDAVQLEEGDVATGWKPGNAGPAVVLDVGGVAVDRTFGGIFRLQGGDGATRSRVELHQKGLRFAQDTELSSPSTGVLAVNDVPIATGTLPVIKTVRQSNMGSLAGATNADYTITWPSAFADLNYTVSVTLWTEGVPAGRQLSCAIMSKTVSTVTIRVHNNTASTAINVGWHAIGIHD